ncbi:MAG: metal ABC transporter permease [Planctomycetota bacterium]
MTGSLMETWELSTTLFRDGFVSLVVASAILPPLGTLLLLRRMPFVAVAVPALAGAGVALAYFLWPMLVVAARETLAAPPAFAQNSGAAIVVGVALLWLSRKGIGERIDAAAALVFVASLALSEILLLESIYDEVAHRWLHHGHVLSILEAGRNRVVVTCVCLGLVFVLARRELWLAAVDREQATLSGLPAGRWLFLTLALVGSACAVLVPELGPQVVLALLLAPATLLRSVCGSLVGYASLSAVVGTLSAALTFFVSVSQDWPVAPALVVSLVIIGTIARVVVARVS